MTYGAIALEWRHIFRTWFLFLFYPSFSYGAMIETRFAKEDYRVVPLTLEMGRRRESLYRSYTDTMFPEGEQYEPKFFSLKKGPQNFGFAWVCINGRRVIRDVRMRGLLIKKFGFSDREQELLGALL